MELNEMEMFWFFQLQLRWAYDSNFRFSQGQKHSYDCDYNSDYDK